MTNNQNIIAVKGTGRSMFPYLPDGTVIILERKYSEFLSVGDIVYFRLNDKKVIHRIIAIKGRNYLTKGDNENVTDGWIGEDKIIAKAKIIKVNGKMINMYTFKSRIINYLITLLSITNYKPKRIKRTLYKLFIL